MQSIIIIEDEEQVRTSIRDLLLQIGYNVSEAMNGAEAMEIIGRYIPDLIISDIMMPVMDGYALLRELQNSALTASIPLIFLTAKDDLTDIRRGMNLGAVDYLTKPFKAGDLIKAISLRIKKQNQ